MGKNRSNDRIGSSIGRFLRGLGYTAAVLIVLAALAPTIIAKTPLGRWIVGRALAGLPITVEFGSLSLGWFTNISIDDVHVRDQGGQPIADVPRVEIDRNLLNLLVSRNDLGSIRLERPTVEIRMTPETSNVEQLLDRWPKSAAPAAPSSPSRPSSTKYALDIAQGVVRLLQTDGATWELKDVDIEMKSDTTATPSLSGRMKAVVHGGDRPPGSINVAFKGAHAGDIAGVADLEFQTLPLAVADPFLSRSQPGMRCFGTLSGTGYARWKLAPDQTPVFALGIQATGDGVAVAGGPLEKDRLNLRRLTIPLLKIEYNGSEIGVDCHNQDIACELGKVCAAGRFAFGKSLASNLSTPGSMLRLDVNLAALSRELPRTLNLHDDVALTAGRITFDGSSGIHNGSPFWEGTFKTTDIRGLRGEKPIAWDDPLALKFKVRQTDRSWPDIEHLECRSRFLDVNGSANATELRLTAHSDLTQLAAPLSQFVDVGSWGLGGVADAKLSLTRTNAKTIVVDAGATLDRFRWGPWQEERLVLDADAEIRTADDVSTIDKSATLRVISGEDVLDVTLREPILLSAQGQTGALYGKLDGNLARWKHRLKAFVPALADFDFEGQAKGQIWLNLQPRKVEVQSVLLSANDFGMKLGTSRLRDPKVELQASLIYAAESGIVELKDSQLRSQAMVVHTPKLTMDLTKGKMTGAIVYKGDVGKLQNWFAPPKNPAEAWSGALSGKADLASSAEGFDIDVQAKIENAVLGPTASPRFVDPNVQFSARGKYDAKPGVLRMDAIQLVSQVGSLQGRMQLARLDTLLDLDLAGVVEYDLARAEPIVKTYLGAGARVEGRDRREFRVAGPLRPKGAAAAISYAALKGNAGLKWNRIVAYGAEVGPADLNANLASGWLKVDPVKTTISQGSLMLAPNVRLEPASELVLPPGVVDRAKITREMCASALGYTLPLLANVATVEGELSLQLASARVPFDDPAKSDVAGVLRLHSAKVGPGPIVSEIVGLLKTVAPYSVIRDNQVKFRLVKGRVHHENLELILPENIVVRSSGSVGLDGSLDMIAEVPLPAKLLGNIKIPAEIARTPIRLPISGTIDRPRIDSRALAEVLRDAGRDAATGLILKGLDKLIRPK